MNPKQSIESRDLNIGQVFQDFYAVPDYQRAYVWKAPQVEQLLLDVVEEMPSGPANGRPTEYFIGSIVVCPGADGVLDLVDGQQRMTTLFIILCALRDRLRELKDTVQTPIDGQLAAQSMDDYGRSLRRHRLELQYEDAKGVLEGLAEHGKLSGLIKTDSAENIAAAYATASAFLAREFGADPGKVRAFYAYLVNRVKLIRIMTEGVAKALKIFETVNDRGVSLDSMDLLKNLLFIRAGQEEFGKLKGIWDQLQQELRSAGEKPLRFLRYFILSRFAVEQLREDAIYDWLKKNEGLVGFGDKPLVFAGELLDAARAYGRFLRAEGEDGKLRPALQSMRLLGGNAARQHLILLLAGRHLPPALFDRLVREIENLFFAYVITREPTRDFERDFARWAPELLAAKDAAALDALVANRLRPVRAGLAVRFAEAFERLSGDDLQAYRLRYVLAKLTQAVEIGAYGDTEGTRWLQRFVDPKQFEVEHIFPATPDEACFGEFSDRSGKYTQRLGNLVLVEQGINSSLGRKPFSSKRATYAQSQLLLTRAIADLPKVGANTRINAAVAGFTSFKCWTPVEVAARQAQLVTLAQAVWDMPAGAEAVQADGQSAVVAAGE